MHKKVLSGLDIFRKGQPWIEESSADLPGISRSQYLTPKERLGFHNPDDNRRQYIIHNNVMASTGRNRFPKFHEREKKAGKNL